MAKPSLRLTPHSYQATSFIPGSADAKKPQPCPARDTNTGTIYRQNRPIDVPTYLEFYSFTVNKKLRKPGASWKLKGRNTTKKAVGTP
jgi:hypothetical protein